MSYLVPGLCSIRGCLLCVVSLFFDCRLCWTHGLWFFRTDDSWTWLIGPFFFLPFLFLLSLQTLVYVYDRSDVLRLQVPSPQFIYPIFLHAHCSSFIFIDNVSASVFLNSCLFFSAWKDTQIDCTFCDLFLYHGIPCFLYIHFLSCYTVVV